MDVYIKQWRERAQIDYFTMFIQAWIPYNAWYMNQFYDESANRKSDSDIIYYVGHYDNTYRARIISLLRNTDADSVCFRNLIACLHRELLAHSLPSGDNPLTLDTICISPQFGDIAVNGSYLVYDIKCSYFRQSLSRGAKRIKIEAINHNTGATKHLIEQLEWDLRSFPSIPEYVAISNETLKRRILELYEQLNPKRPTPIILPPILNNGNVRAPKFSIAIGDDNPIYVTDNVALVAEVIIHLLYELRCKLFHGEIKPLEAYQNIYRYAYEIQNMLNPELI